MESIIGDVSVTVTEYRCAGARFCESLRKYQFPWRRQEHTPISLARKPTLLVLIYLLQKQRAIASQLLFVAKKQRKNNAEEPLKIYIFLKIPAATLHLLAKKFVDDHNPAENQARKAARLVVIKSLSLLYRNYVFR